LIFFKCPKKFKKNPKRTFKKNFKKNPKKHEVTRDSHAANDLNGTRKKGPN